MSQIVCIEVSMDDYKKIMEIGIEHNRKTIDEADFDYTNDKEWQKLKSASLKAYKKLKEREFNIRHNM